MDLLVDLVVLVLDLDLAVQAVVDHHHHLQEWEWECMDHLVDLDIMEEDITSIRCIPNLDSSIIYNGLSSIIFIVVQEESNII